MILFEKFAIKVPFFSNFGDFLAIFCHKSAILKLERGIKPLQIDFFDDQSTHDQLYVIYILHIYYLR